MQASAIRLAEGVLERIHSEQKISEELENDKKKRKLSDCVMSYVSYSRQTRQVCTSSIDWSLFCAIRLCWMSFRCKASFVIIE